MYYYYYYYHSIYPTEQQQQQKNNNKLRYENKKYQIMNIENEFGRKHPFVSII